MALARSEEVAEVEWLGALVPREDLNAELVRSADLLADAARAGNWELVLKVLDGEETAFAPGPNSWRRGGTSWTSPLHQVAWLGGPDTIAIELVSRGAWRALRDAQGKRPLDIAIDRSAAHLRDALQPKFDHVLPERVVSSMSARLADLVTAAMRKVRCNSAVRHLDVACLAERGDRVWFPIPGMVGGFAVELFNGRLHVESWSRASSGSGRAWVITETRTTLVDAGFV